MKKYMLIGLLIINGISLADDPGITINLSLNTDLAELNNIKSARIVWFQYWPRGVSESAEDEVNLLDEGETITLTKDHTTTINVPTLSGETGKYVPFLRYYTEENPVDLDSPAKTGYATFTVTEENQNIALPLDASEFNS